MGKGAFSCEHCGSRYKIEERGIGLVWATTLIGVGSASLLALFFSMFDMSMLIETVILLAVLVLVLKLAIVSTIRLNPVPGIYLQEQLDGVRSESRKTE
jgi:hypothetical protein